MEDKLSDDVKTDKTLKDYIKSNYPKMYDRNLVCIKTGYTSAQCAIMDQLLQFKTNNDLCCLRLSPMAVAGVPRPIELPFIMDMSPIGFQTKEKRRKPYGIGLDYALLDESMEVRNEMIAEDAEEPLVISYANNFNLIWNSQDVTSSSNTKCSIWSPVLATDKEEFFLGHLAIPGWIHPSSNGSCNLVTVRTGKM